MTIVFERKPRKEVRIFRRIAKDILIRDEEVVLQRNPIIEEGVEIVINDGGEFLTL